MTGAVLAAVAAVGPVVGAAVPGLGVFAATFTALVGALVVRGVAHASRPRLTSPAPTALVALGVAASIAATVVFLLREPAAARHLPPAAAVYLALALAGCLWFAIASRRGTNLAAVGAVVFAAWFLLALQHRRDTARARRRARRPAGCRLLRPRVRGEPARPVARSGLRVTLWTVVAAMPLAYALWLPEALRRHAIDGRTLDGELIAPVGVNLADALTFSFGVFPVLGVTVGLVGAALGARLDIRSAVAADPS